MSSLWKKEISLRKKSPVDAGPPAHETSESAAVEATPLPPETAAAAPVDVAELPKAAGDYGWLTANFDPNEHPADMPAVTAPAVAAPAPEREAETPTLPAVALPTTDAVPSVTPPQASAADEAKVPFWKKELSLGRGKQKAERAPKKAKEPAQPKAKRAKPASSTKTPFWKRELSFGKSEDAPSPPAAATESKDPFWKRKIGAGKSTSPDGTATATPPEPKAKRVKPSKKQAPVQGKGGLVGLKIGASQIAAARVVNTNGSPELLQVARMELPDGLVVGGELRDVEGLANALKEMFAANKLPKRGVRLGIANNRIGVRTFEIGGIDDPRQLANAIRFRAQETLPIPLEEAVLDWQVLSEHVDEAGQAVRRVLLVVAYRELVDRYVLACKKAGIKLAGIDLEAFAMLRALAAPPAPGAPAATGAQVVVNVGHDRSTFAVSDGRVCEFTRVLGWGGQNLSVAVARALDITPSEATPIKHAVSLVATSAPPDGYTIETMNVARDTISRELQSFARELVSSLRFYQNQPGSLGIGELVLTGGTAHLPGLADELNRLIGVPVRVGEPLNRVALAKKFRESDEYAIGSLTVAIGLGIED